MNLEARMSCVAVFTCLFFCSGVHAGTDRDLLLDDVVFNYLQMRTEKLPAAVSPGQLDMAEEYASKISNSDLRMYNIVRVIDVALKSGDRERAKRLLDLAGKRVGSVSPKTSRAATLFDLAAKHARLGDYDQAWQMLMRGRKLADEVVGKKREGFTKKVRRQALKEILISCSDAGTLHEAMSHLGLDGPVIEALLGVAHDHWARGEKEQSRVYVGLVPEGFLSDSLVLDRMYLDAIAKKQYVVLRAGLGSADRAIALTEAFEDCNDRLEALAGIAVEVYRNGDSEKASELLARSGECGCAKVAPEYVRTRYIVECTRRAATAYARIGDLNVGLELADAIRTDAGDFRLLTLARVIVAYGESGATERALELADEFPYELIPEDEDPFWSRQEVRSVALEELAALFAEIGELEMAVDAAAKIENSASMKWALRHILDKLWTVDLDRRLALLNDMIDLPLVIEDLLDRSRIKLRIGEHLLVAGKRAEATEVFESTHAVVNSEGSCSRAKVLAYLDAIRIKHSLPRGTVPKEVRSQSRKRLMFLRCN